MYNVQDVAKRLIDSLKPSVEATIITDYHISLNGLAFSENEEPMCFDDRRINFGWIEPVGDVKFEKVLNSFSDCDNFYQTVSMYSLFFQSPNLDAEKLITHFSGVLGSMSLLLRTGNYNTQSVIENKYREFNKEVVRQAVVTFCNWSVIRIDFGITTQIPTYTPNCPIDLCKTC